jgi:signal peptidase II
MVAEVAHESGAPPARARRAVLAAAAAAVAVLVAVDQATKAWAVAALADGPVEVFGDAVRLNLTRNPGGAFGNFAGLTPLLALAALVVTAVLVRAAARTTDRLTLVGLVLVLSGALGNLVDRLARDPGFLRGEVVDFVDVGPWPIFNVADSCITVGVVLLLAHGAFGAGRGEPS